MQVSNEILKHCRCGCGLVVKRDYINGHNRRGYKASPDTIEKLRKSHLGQVSWNKGSKATEATKEKLRIAHLGQHPNRRGAKHREESIEKMRAAKFGKKASPATRMRMSMAGLGRTVNGKTREKLSAKLRKLWESQDHARKMGRAWGIKPNKPETTILNLLESSYPGQWKYTGDFSFTINGRCPDFVNCNGQKKIIEVFGDYWHRGEDPEDRANVFKPFGYEILVIWERELKDIPSVTRRIGAFAGGDL